MPRHNTRYRTGGGIEIAELHSMSVMKSTTLLRKRSDQHLREPARKCGK